MPIPIDRLVRSRRKTIALIVQGDGTLTVRAPLRMAEGRIRAFVEGHAEWIKEKKNQAKASAVPAPRGYLPGEAFPFLGVAYPLAIVPGQRQALALVDGRFQLASSALPEAEQTFTRWYRRKASEVLSQRAAQLASVHGLEYQKVRISSARTRWGSCSPKGVLSFTWRLVMAPPEVIDYVITHELAHLKVRNHSKSYWEQVGWMMPAFKQWRVWLRKNGASLNL